MTFIFQDSFDNFPKLLWEHVKSLTKLAPSYGRFVDQYYCNFAYDETHLVSGSCRKNTDIKVQSWSESNHV